MSGHVSSDQKKPGDPLLGDLLSEGLTGDVVFILYPVDLGVERNGGRPGARLGPDKFLSFLRRMGTVRNPEYGVDLGSLKLGYYHIDPVVIENDEGDAESKEDALVQAHARLTNAVCAVLDNGGLPFVVGGGNDQSVANWRALCQSKRAASKLGIVNVDAHLDVRPLLSRGQPHSGSPFRQILDEARSGGRKQTVLWEFAAQGSQCSQEHADFVTQHGGTILWLKDVQNNAALKFSEILRAMKQSSMSAFVSFDLDSIQSSDCPGVSCPANVGLTAKDALNIMRTAGAADHVQLVDVSELNPLVEGYITPRLAVQMAYSFLLGFAQRTGRRNYLIETQLAGVRSRPFRLRINHLSQLVCVEDVKKQGFRTGRDMAELRVIQDGTILVDREGRIAYAGPANAAPLVEACQIDTDLDGNGKSAIPGLCDAHTHSVWAGDRIHEFVMKLAGASYMDIHKTGGGINFTVKHTRDADEGSLYNSLEQRLLLMHRNGTTLVECKSGYGLDTETEMKMLRVIDRTQQNVSFIDVAGSFCGAHSIPEGSSEEEAMNSVVDLMIPALASEQKAGRLSSIRLIDVFVESGVFSPQSAEYILRAGEEIGLLGNFHGDELTYQGCGELAGKLRCRAVSHLEHVSDEGISAMRETNTAAVLLPTTAHVLRIAPPPARKLIDSGVPVALGSDFNPNAHCLSMPHVMNLACLTMNMSVEEALVAGTLNAAFSMGMQDTHGSLETGKHADIILVDANRWEHIVYQFGGAPPLCAVIKDGVPTFLEHGMMANVR